MDPVQASPVAPIGGNRILSGHASGSSVDAQDTLAFSSLTGVRPRIDPILLEKAGEAYAKTLAGDEVPDPDDQLPNGEINLQTRQYSNRY
jgi:D-arabinose 1-dehydrogenase-like Zn-dependent alcohol dehydrogenase